MGVNLAEMLRRGARVRGMLGERHAGGADHPEVDLDGFKESDGRGVIGGRDARAWWATSKRREGRVAWRGERVVTAGMNSGEER